MTGEVPEIGPDVGVDIGSAVDADPEPTASADAAMTPAEAAWPFNPDSPHVAGILESGGRVRTLLVDVTGVDWCGVEGHIETVLESAQQSGLVPVFLIDTLDVMLFYERGLVFDAVPRAETQARVLPDVDWTGYIARRRRQVVEKWRPAATVRLGGGAGGGQ